MPPVSLPDHMGGVIGAGGLDDRPHDAMAACMEKKKKKAHQPRFLFRVRADPGLAATGRDRISLMGIT